MRDTAGLADYDAPPVVETVIAVEFSSLRPFGVLALAKLIEMWGEAYPLISERDALLPSRPVGQGPDFSLQFREGLPALRLWLAEPDNKFLIQVQHDRLTLNWRRLDGEASSYPGFDGIRDRFAGLLHDFLGLIAGTWEEPAALVTEWSYVNRINAETTSTEPFEVWSDPNLEHPTKPLATRFQHVRSFPVDGGEGQLEVTVDPIGIGELAESNMTISAKCFHRPDTTLTMALDRAEVAHLVARRAFEATTTAIARAGWGERESH